LGLVVEAAPKILDLRNAVRQRIGERLGGELPSNVDTL
jgi:hypothetical protein